jgi:hypothetical protein
MAESADLWSEGLLPYSKNIAAVLMSLHSGTYPSGCAPELASLARLALLGSAGWEAGAGSSGG